MKVIIAGGGTGGHIYPAISIAQALQKIDSQTQVLFVGTDQGLEKKIIPQAGYNLQLIQSGKLNFEGQIIEKIKSLMKIPIGLLQSMKLIFIERPDFVIGVGGYASAPMTLMAALLGIKTAVWEPNAHPGMANRILSRFVTKTYLVFPEAARFLKSKINLTLGMPLRGEVENHLSDSAGPQSQFTLLCFGGSQGSIFLNDRLSEFVLKNPDLASKMKIIHQTGARDYLRMKEKYKNSDNVELHEYIFDMPKYYRQADLLFCRGGASTLAEAAMYGVVPIVVPLPAADDHQQKNAESLVNKDAGFMFLQKSFNADKFKTQIENLMENKNTLKEMSERLRNLSQKGAAQKIAQDILSSKYSHLQKDAT